MQTHDKFAGLMPADAVLLEELIRCGREMRPYPGHDVVARKTGWRTPDSVSDAFGRLEQAGLIERDRRGRKTVAVFICASGRRIDFRDSTVRKARRPQGGMRGL